METYGPQHLQPTYYIDSDNSEIIAFAEANKGKGTTKKEQAISLYLAVRDGFRYNPYNITSQPAEMKASFILNRGDGHCVEKAILLAACARAVGIPARLEFADVRNHISTQKFLDLLKSDIFAMHGITQLFVNGQWTKATPAFNKELCTYFNVAPLDYDGENDSIFQEFDGNDRKFMEYVANHGVFDDYPREYFLAVTLLNYPHLFNYERLRKLFWETKAPVEVAVTA
ncbi:MAG: transglutaminase family protein [Flavobacteriales bacterium]|nr:transglutaminase family protein [Flavobacteriales bacterium]